MAPERGSGPVLLGFELATEACSVALSRGHELLARHVLAPRRHAELALPFAEALLAEAGLAKSAIDALAVGIGPGTFTGVRLAISLVQGLALGLDRPVLPVSTLAALAEPYLAQGPVVAAIDARMGELYLGGFEADADGRPRAWLDEALRPATADALDGLRLKSAITTAARPMQAVGSGFAAAEGEWWQALAEHFQSVAPAALPTAAAVVRIARIDWQAGRWWAAERLEPSYLRNKVALTAAEQAAARTARSSGRLTPG